MEFINEFEFIIDTILEIENDPVDYQFIKLNKNKYFLEYSEHTFLILLKILKKNNMLKEMKQIINYYIQTYPPSIHFINTLFKIKRKNKKNNKFYFL